MDENNISREEHREFVKRMDEANNRMERRLTALEEDIKEVHNISLTVERIATTVDNMEQEQKRQGERLTALENRDGEKWRSTVGHIVCVIAGAVVCYILSRVGI